MTIRFCDGTVLEAAPEQSWAVKVGTTLQMGSDAQLTTQEIKAAMADKRCVRLQRGQFWRVLESVDGE